MGESTTHPIVHPAPAGTNSGAVAAALCRRAIGNNTVSALGRKRDVYNLLRWLLGFYPTTQSSTAPIVRFDARSRLLSEL